MGCNRGRTRTAQAFLDRDDRGEPDFLLHGRSAILALDLEDRGKQVVHRERHLHHIADALAQQQAGYRKVDLRQGGDDREIRLHAAQRIEARNRTAIGRVDFDNRDVCLRNAFVGQHDVRLDLDERNGVGKRAEAVQFAGARKDEDLVWKACSGGVCHFKNALEACHVLAVQCENDPSPSSLVSE